jgi:hypothetical protein
MSSQGVCPVRWLVTTQNCVLLNYNSLVIAVGLGPEVSFRASSVGSDKTYLSEFPVKEPFLQVPLTQRRSVYLSLCCCLAKSPVNRTVLQVPTCSVYRFRAAWNETVLQLWNVFCASRGILYFYCWYFVTSWKQVGVLCWKWIPVLVVPMFVTVSSIPRSREQWILFCTDTVC